MRVRSAAALATSLVASTAIAAESESLFDLSLEQLMTTPVRGVSLYEGREVANPAAVTVITHDEIRSLRARTLLDVLNIVVPGFDALPYRSGTGSLAPQLSSRGIRSSQSQQVLVLINGFIELNDLAQGAPKFPNELDLRMIERIEVSRSPSPTHGGAAITVINLVTRDQYVEGAEAGVDGAYHQGAADGAAPARLRVGGVVGQRIDDWHVGASVAVTKDDGQDHRVETFDGTRLANDGTDLSLGVSLTARHRANKFVVRGLILQEETSAWFTGLTANGADGLAGTDRSTAALEVAIHPLPNLTFRFGGSAGKQRSARDYADGTLVTNLDDGQLSAQVQLLEDFTFFGVHELDIGIEYELNAVLGHYFETSYGAGFTRTDRGALTENGAVTRNVFGGWLADTWTLAPDLVASAAVRIDWYQGWGDRDELAVSPRAALGYQVTSELDLRLIHASSVRPATLYERLGIDAFPVIGDPTVTGEQVRSLELSADYHDGPTTARVTPFVQWHSDRLDFVRVDDGPVLVAQNVGSTRSVGVEAEFSATFANGSRAFAHAAFVESVDTETGAPTPDWPRLLAGGGAVIRLGAFDLTNTVYLRALRTRPEGLQDLDGAAPAHFRWDSSVGYRLSELLELHAQVRNVTDDDNLVLTARRDLALPQRGRSFFIGVEMFVDGAP